MLIEKPVTFGKLVGRVYDFEKAGDDLPRHVHDASDVHISICARGTFRVYGDGWEMHTKPGQVLDWQPGTFHGFTALEDDSRLVNIIKG
jgi:quercetin dioxygenase-like cupin family protein